MKQYVRVRVLRDTLGHKKGEVIEMFWLHAAEAVGNGWATPIPTPVKEAEARETR